MITYRGDGQNRYMLFRLIVLIFSLVLMCQATWILASELARPPLIGVPNSSAAAAAAAGNRKQAALAASFGVVRGDLWAQDALTYFELFLNDGLMVANEKVIASAPEARDAAYRALHFAPHDARIWLILAALDSRLDWLRGETASSLQMSYYTGANESALIPLRLRLAVQSPSLDEKDFQQLVRHDIQNIALRKPDLEFAIALAYRDAPLQGRQLIEDALNEIDPSLMKRLRLSK